MTIVRTRRPKPRRKAAPLPIARIVSAKKPGAQREEPETDPEVEARVKAWMRKQMRSPGA